MPTEGQVFLNGQLVNETGPDRIVVFQDALFPWLNVLENVEFSPKVVGVEKKNGMK